jgi:primase-polymerase (primpol)-like protein
VVTTLKVPPAIESLPQWVLWRREEISGRPTKVPYTAWGRKASSTTPSDWVSFDRAVDGWAASLGHYSGVGFVFSGRDGLAGIDLDHCIGEDGQLKPWARTLLGHFGDTYAEVSPSGSGIKIWCHGSLPKGIKRVLPNGMGAVEAYSKGRYFTVTGNRFGSAPLEIEDHSEALQQLYHWAMQQNAARPARVESGSPIPEGQRHNWLVSICGALRLRGVCEEAIESCLQIANEKQCGKSSAEIAQLINSTKNWGRA